jgi:eukaryotic-like serine/threonine-protein kinase
MSGATLVWLDALAGGLCTPEAFLDAMREHFRGDPDEGWEVLALLDQYYRRGKIKSETFLAVKSQLEGSALNVDDDPMADVPPIVRPTRAPTPTPTPASAPAPAATSRSPSTSTSASSSATAEMTAREPRPAAREIAVGEVLRNRYRIRAILGHGGMGNVFEAVDEYRLDMPKMGQRLAIKVLRTAVSKRRDLLTELQLEFQHLQSLSHPNIIRVHEFDRDGDTAFFTMEYLSGAPLIRVLAARNAVALPRPDALAMIRDIGAALSHAHSRGVVHGDFNPRNIFITNDGELRVLHFGASRNSIPTLWPPNGELPQTAAVDTRGYASCEVLEGQRPDRRDDVFAFACVAYELLSGQHPFPQRTAIEARSQRLRPSRPSRLTGQQWRVLREGLHWDRERRPAEVQALLEQFGAAGAAARLPSLQTLVNITAPRKYTTGRAIAIVVAFVLLVSAGYWAATNYDYLSRQVAGWTSQAKSAIDHSTALPSVPSDQTPPVATNEPPPVAATRAAPASPVTPTPVAPPVRAPLRAAVPASTPAPQPPSTAHAKTVPVARAPVAEASPRASSAGSVRVELAADTVDVQAGETAAHVIVGRRGNLHGDASFTWWTESGTAKPGRDFSAVTPRAEHIADGSGSVSLNIPISGAPRTQPKSFYVVIDRTDSGAALGARTLTMVTLQPPG